MRKRGDVIMFACAGASSPQPKDEAMLKKLRTDTGQ